MASNFLNKRKSFSTSSLSAEEKEVPENEVDDSLSEISASGSLRSSDAPQGIDNPSRDRANSSGCKSDISRADIIEEEAVSTASQPDNNNVDQPRVPNWSAALCTPSTHAAYTPASDVNSLKENLHGLALKLSVDRAKVLSRTGKACASLLTDVAALHDELSLAILKSCPTVLEAASSATPMEEFARNVNRCIISFVHEEQELGRRLRNEIVRPWVDFNAAYVERTPKVFAEYVNSRSKCAQARKEALKMRQKYVGVKGEAEASIQALRKARATSNPARKSTERSDTSSSVITEEDKKEDDVQWERALKEFGKRHGISKQCDQVARALEEIQSAEGQYCNLVELENEAVSNAQDMERKGLDAMQSGEEERIVFLLQSLDRFLQIGKEAFENMSLDLAVNPLNLDDSNHHKELPVPASGPSLFMSPRRRTQSEDGPAINETRMLNLPDNIAVLRDNMKSHLGKQSARLKTLKSVSSFNESLASAIETFASGLHARLESDGYAGKVEGKNVSPVAVVLNKNEGQQVLKEWKKVVRSLSEYATNASQLANQIKSGNSELYNILLPAERELKFLKENEETRWKNVCDAAKGETKAKMKQKQYMTDMQKAQTRLSIEEEDGGTENTEDAPQDDKKANFMGQSVKMNASMNKAMGKMFSVLPGGGEDVMNKVLRPEQRRGILVKNLDEAKRKTNKATESFEFAQSNKSLSIANYQSETEVALHKFKTNERYVWAQIQKSLENSVTAIKAFRDSQQNLMAPSDSSSDIKAVVQSELLHWTTTTETRVKEYLARYTAEWKDKENEYESGFSLQLVLEDSSDIKELVNLVTNDNDDDLDHPAEDSPVVESPEKSIPLPEVPIDPLIKNMDQIFCKKLKNVSIESYYSAGWSEERPLYAPWLEKKGSFDVSVSDWERCEGGFKHGWSGETFPQKRVIKFKFKRTTHLYIGPPIAGVTQTQYCIVDGNDRCVTHMTVEMDGIPYSDVFAVEVRWAARRQGEKDLIIDAGVHVRFIKSSMFAKQIKTGTLTETKPIHLDLFEVIKLAIASEENNGEGVELELEEEPEIETKVSPVPVEVETRKQPDTLSPFQRCAQQLSSTFWALPREYQVLSGVLFFGSVWMWTRGGSRNDRKLDDLQWKVDQLNNELNEIKTLLNTVVQLMKENN